VFSVNDNEEGANDMNIYDPTHEILIDGLTKKFGNLKAVDNIRFSIKKDEVFTILGHNGAGKTTLIYMLTGMHTVSKGNAYVYGYNIIDHID